MKYSLPALLLFVLLAVNVDGAQGQSPPTRFTPDFQIQPDDVTVLMAADGRNPDGLKAWIDDHRRLQVKNWPLGGETTWDVRVADAGDYATNVLFSHSVPNALRVIVAAGESQAAGISEPIRNGEWRRFRLPETLKLAQGKQTVSLRITAIDDTAGGKIEILSVELVKPAVRDRLRDESQAMKNRADTDWFRKAGFGLMVHWTSRCMPRSGPPKPYAEAVRDFDVKAFADQVAATGAGFVTFTTSHSQMYFPAPLTSLDRILPGRTADRDLVADLAETLGQRGIRLMLYYHDGASSDPAWQRASGFWETDSSTFWNHWMEVIAEVGDRYQDRLAGWWFDDGTAGYYYRNPPWQRLAVAAKAGNPRRIICFNPWTLPSATDFQDFAAGEGSRDPSARGWLKPGDGGRISGGAYEGLQASAAVVMESDWIHGKRDTEIPKPRITADELAELLRRSRDLQNVLMLNCEIYQDGTLSAPTVELIREANEASRESRSGK